MDNLIQVAVVGYFMLGTFTLGVAVGFFSEYPTLKMPLWLWFAAVFGWPVLFVLAWLQARRKDR